jgi:hypothetical protein
MSPMKKLNIAVPPMFERAIGYYGQSRYVAFYWSMGGDDVFCEDGMEIVSGLHISAWHVLMRHRLMWPYTVSFNFGNQHMEAVYWLVLDRQDRVFYAMRTQAARELLLKQHQRTMGDKPVLDIGRLLDIIDEMASPAFGTDERSLEEEQVRRRIEQRNNTQLLERWLNERANPARPNLSLVR